MITNHTVDRSILSTALKRLAISNLLMFSITIGFLLDLIPQENEPQKTMIFLVAFFILVMDLFYTLTFIHISWRYARDRTSNTPIIILYGILSLVARITMALEVFDIWYLQNNLSTVILGISSIAFGCILWSISSSEIGGVHKSLFDLLVIANCSGIGVLFSGTTITLFLGIKSLLPLVSSLFYVVIATDLYRLELKENPE